MSSQRLSRRDLEGLFPGRSELARRMRALDWSQTELGKPQHWPPHLRVALRLCLTSHVPVAVLWGSHSATLYNDGCIPYLGERGHPGGLGGPGRACWSAAIWEALEPLIARVRDTAEAAQSDDLRLWLARRLPREEVFVRLALDPILSADGRSVEGMFCSCAETTHPVVAARRLGTLQRLGDRSQPAQTVDGACRRAAAAISGNPGDLPFAALYAVDTSGTHATRCASTPLPEDIALPGSVSLAGSDPAPWPLASVARTLEPAEVADPAARVLPITTAAQQSLAAILVVGLSPQRPLDAAYRTFLDLVAGQIRAAVADARASEAAAEHAAALAARDRARTLFARFMQHLPGLAWIKDEEGRYVFANDAAEKAFRLPKEDLYGRTDREVFPPEIAAPFVENDRLARERGAGVQTTEVLEHDDGVLHHSIVSKFPIPGIDGGSLVGGIAIDITDRMQAEEALRQSEERLRMALGAARMAAWEWSLAEDRVVLSGNAAETFGFPPGATLGSSREGFQLVHPDDVASLRETVLKAIQESGSFLARLRIVRPDTGEIAWMEPRGELVRESPDAPARLVGVVADISERMRAEELLQAQRHLLELVARGAPLEHCLEDLCRSIERIDPRVGACVLLAAPDGSHFASVVAPSFPGFAEAIRNLPPSDGVAGACEALAGGGAVACEDLAADPRWPDAWKAHFLAHGIRAGCIAPISETDGPAPGIVLLCFDKPRSPSDWELRLSEMATSSAGIALRRDRSEQALREADRRKDEFLATLAHELRNPLAPLLNSLELMKLAPDDAASVEQARATMERQIRQMVRLIDDLLDVSRISRGKVELRKERLDLARIVQLGVETARPVIDQANHHLAVELPPEPISVDADLTRLGQVFSNLLNNAAKFTEKGGRVSIAVERQGGEAVVSVRDQGIGIPEPMLSRVFELFTQVDRSLEKAQGGLGIGLTLVKRLVELHGGSVEARSEGPDRGSEFVVRLPVAPLAVADPAREGAAAAARAGGRRRILVVDDNDDHATSLAMLLRIMGNDTRTACDGLEALEVAEAFRPEVVLLDIGMPRLNGYDTARRLRRQPGGERAVLVAVTGWGQEEDRRRSREAGFDHHLVKPVEQASLERLLAELRAT